MWTRLKNVKSKHKNLELPEDEKLLLLDDVKRKPGEGAKPSVMKKILSKLSLKNIMTNDDLRDLFEATLAVSAFAFPIILMLLGFVGWGAVCLVIPLIVLTVISDNDKRRRSMFLEKHNKNKKV